VKRKADVDVEDCADFAKMEEESRSNEGSKWEPPYWRQHLENIRQMRSLKDAPVDSMGAHCCADPKADPPTRRYQILLALMLSSQTKDNVTSAAMTNLRQHGCTVENVMKTSEEKLVELIYPVGFYKRKAVYVKKTTQILRDKYGDDIPSSVEELCKLPGVGPKMAHLTMDLAWEKPSGIGVDTHVHRICNRMGWCRKKTQLPEQTRTAVESWLPSELWSDVNVLMVGFGQQICTPLKPRCGDCLNRNICVYARRESDDHPDSDD